MLTFAAILPAAATAVVLPNKGSVLPTMPDFLGRVDFTEREARTALSQMRRTPIFMPEQNAVGNTASWSASAQPVAAK